MPMQPDPLSNIMNLLRNQGAVDPNQKASREASLQQQGMAHGIRGGVQPPMPGMPPDMGGMPQQGDPGGGLPSQEEGTETGMEEAGMDYRLLLTDQMNETILSIKQAIHHSQDPEEIRDLEKKAQRIRKDIQDLGGEPIYADESIEEGIQKLKGHGYIGRDRLDQEADYTSGFTPDTQMYDRIDWRQYQQPQGGDVDPTGGMGSSTWTSTPPPQIGGGSLYPGPGDPGSTFFSAEDQEAQMVREPEAPAPSPYDQYRGGGGGIPDAQPTDTLGHIMLGIGEERAEDAWLTSWIRDRMEQDAPQMPELQYDMDYFNNMMEEHGLVPRSQQEIDDAAAAIVERQRLAKSQLVQRELDKFNREFPNEFEKAKDRLFEAGAQYKGVQQEEFAGRGMFYSSVMAGQMKEIDSEVMGHINDISVAAANRVMELEDQLRDIAEWAIVEEEALRHELMMEEDSRRFKIATMAQNAAIQFDQNMLTRAHNQAMIDINWAQNQLDQGRFLLERQDQQDQQAGAAAMLNNPVISSQLRAAGLTAEQISSMPLGQQAALANNALAFAEFDLTKRQTEANIWATQAQINLNERKFNLQLDELERALDMEESGPGFGEMDHYAFGHVSEAATRFKQLLPLLSDDMAAGRELQPGVRETASDVVGRINWVIEGGLYDSPETAKFLRSLRNEATNVINYQSGGGESSDGWFTRLRRSLNLLPDSEVRDISTDPNRLGAS